MKSNPIELKILQIKKKNSVKIAKEWKKRNYQPGIATTEMITS